MKTIFMPRRAMKPTLNRRARIARCGVGLMVSAAAAWAHLFLLIAVQRRLPADPVIGTILTIAALAVPAAVMYLLFPQTTVRHWYRWPTIWALSMLSYVSTPVLLLADLWVIYRTGFIEGQSEPISRPRALIATLMGRT